MKTVLHLQQTNLRRLIMAVWVDSFFSGLIRTILRLLYFVHTFFRTSQTIPITHRKHFIQVSVPQEILIGRRAFKKYMVWLNLRNDRILRHDHPYSIWVRGVAERLIQRAIQEYYNSEMGFMHHFHQKLNWILVVVDANVPSALSFPGGSIVLYTGLLKFCRTEDDLATILAHEVAHLLARHGMERETMCRWAASLFLGRFLTRDDFDDFIMMPWLQPWDRKAELEADQMGLMLMASAGYDPRSAPGFFDLLQSHDEQTPRESSDFRTYTVHPSSEERGHRLRNSSIMLQAIRIYHAYLISLAIYWEQGDLHIERENPHL